MNEYVVAFPDLEMQRYFDMLPSYVQESIMQSGAHPKTLDELVNCASGMID